MADEITERRHVPMSRINSLSETFNFITFRSSSAEGSLALNLIAQVQSCVRYVMYYDSQGDITFLIFNETDGVLPAAKVLTT